MAYASSLALAREPIHRQPPVFPLYYYYLVMPPRFLPVMQDFITPVNTRSIFERFERFLPLLSKPPFIT